MLPRKEMIEMRIGIAGVGRMGSNMALRLLDGGHKLTVWNRSIDKTKPLAGAGASVPAADGSPELFRVCGWDRSASKQVDAAKALMAFLTSPAVKQALKANGFETP